MNDHDSTVSAAAPRAWHHVSIDLRDVIGVAGGCLVLGVAFATDWRAGAAVVGASLIALACRLAR